jgi:hypothetical protein
MTCLQYIRLRDADRFRWVFCQLETLRHSFPAAIRQTLDKLPETLDETYEQILLRIEKAKRNSALPPFPMSNRSYPSTSR